MDDSQPQFAKAKLRPLVDTWSAVMEILGVPSYGAIQFVKDCFEELGLVLFLPTVDYGLLAPADVETARFHIGQLGHSPEARKFKTGKPVDWKGWTVFRITPTDFDKILAHARGVANRDPESVSGYNRYPVEVRAAIKVMDDLLAGPASDECDLVFDFSTLHLPLGFNEQFLEDHRSDIALALAKISTLDPPLVAKSAAELVIWMLIARDCMKQLSVRLDDHGKASSDVFQRYSEIVERQTRQLAWQAERLEAASPLAPQGPEAEQLSTNRSVPLEADMLTPELSAALEVLKAIRSDEAAISGRTPKQAALAWLKANKKELSNDARARIATMVNWQREGGAPPTPTKARARIAPAARAPMTPSEEPT